MNYAGFCITMAAGLILSACGTPSGSSLNSNEAIQARLKTAFAETRPPSERREATFASTSLVSAAELGQMRGGFVTVGGITFDFSITSATLIDGAVQTNLSINSSLAQIPVALRSVLQTGSGNAASIPAATLGSNVLTIVQNSQNDKTIQTFNTLNLNAQLGHYGIGSVLNASLPSLTRGIR
jgi:hypothetical protein